MTRRKDPGPDEPVDFGDLDGEKIEAAYIKVTATVPIDRLLTEGERVILSVEGPVSLPTVERHDGRLVRVHKVKGEKGAEVADRLADEVSDFIRAVDDARQSREQLPFDDEDGGEGDD